MEPNNFAATLDVVQSEVHSFLKRFGFRKKGRTHNKTASEGIIHAINFQMGQYPVGEHHAIPGFRENLYGRFTINLGAFLPAVYEVEQGQAIPEFVQEPNCSIRSRLGPLTRGKDQWFSLSADPNDLAPLVIKLLHDFGFPFLERFNSYEAVLKYYEQHESFPLCPRPRSALIAAIITSRLGDVEKAQSLLKKAHASENKGFQGYVVKLAERLGLQFYV